MKFVDGASGNEHEGEPRTEHGGRKLDRYLNMVA